VIDLGGVIFRYDPSREIVFSTIFFLAGFSPPLVRWMRTGRDAPEAKALRRQCIGRLLLLVLLLPPVAWAMSGGRLGATIRQRHERLIGESLFHRYLGGVDLEGVSLQVTTSESYGRQVVFLEGAKRGERLRVDGFHSPDGKTLLEILLKQRPLPNREE